MNISFDANSGNTNFGALYMPLKKDIIGRTDIFYADLVGIVKPRLEMLAKDVDIYVKPMRASNPGFKITVGKVTESTMKRFFGIIGTTISEKLSLANSTVNCQVADMLIRIVENTKENFVKYREYLTNS